MTDDEVFCAAFELESVAEKRALIESTCVTDPEQQRRIWQLLKMHHKLTSGTGNDGVSILDRPGAVYRAFADSDELLPGRQIGKYVLQEMIGEGATSLVFKANQLSPISREVALKILKPGMDSQRILARFSLEHQVIQRLEHAGITRVFDIGVQENGRPFFAMELVDNPLAITEYAERFDLDLRGRIGLMIAACEIVQHAHQRGVIHRDLKPSNILIEGVPQPVPVPRIIDFGIAKILQADNLSDKITKLGDRFGTPAYMSPEQALMPANGVDIRSDVYSLGVVLYELITGGTPRSHSRNADPKLQWTSEAYWDYEVALPSLLRERRQRLSRHSAPDAGLFPGKSHSSSARAMGGSDRELDLIVLKSIMRDSGQRYQTVADLQRDLQRFLTGEMIDAAGPGLAYRMKKFVLRNRALTVAALVTLTTIIVTSFVTAAFAYRAHSAEQQVRQQLEQTLATQKQLLVERDKAEEAKRQSQSLLRVLQVQTATDRALSRFVKRMLDAVQRGQFVDSASTDSISVDSQLLTKPHERLFIRGDWSWASNRFPAEIINSTFKLTSREVVKALSDEKSTSQAFSPPLANADVAGKAVEVAAQDRESLQSLLLDELKVVLPEKDPFIAEVLDNCGLHALDKEHFKDAERFLSESVRIWGQGEGHRANLVQSRLFLADALLRRGDTRQSEVILNDAIRSLQELPSDNQYLPWLRDFHSQLRAKLESN